MDTTANNNEARTLAAPRIGRETATRRILLADDDAEMRAMVAWALDREGYILQECHDGASLKKWIDRSRSRSTNIHFDLVISDIRMPGLTGLEVLADKQLHGDRMPMILVSAFCDAETEDQARRLGAAALLPKPFEVEDLVARVKELAPIEAPTSGTERLTAEEPEGPSFPLEITFRHEDADPDVRAFVFELAERLERHAEHIHRCRVVIDPFLPGARDGHIVSLIVSTGGRPVVAEVDAAADETDGQLRLALQRAFEIAMRKLDEERDRHARAAAAKNK